MSAVLGTAIANAAPATSTSAPAAPAKPATTTPATTPAKAPVKAVSPAALLKSGETKLNSGDDAGALVEFKAADAAKPTAESAHFVALADDRLGHLHEAVAAYERFIAAAPSTMADEVEIAKKRVAEIRAMPATLKIATTPAGAALSIDGAARSQAQVTPAEVKVAPGTHVLRLTASGYEAFEREVDVGYGTTRSLSLDLVAEPPPPPPVVALPPAPVAPLAPVDMTPAPDAPETPWLTRRTLGFITGGIAVVGVGLGTGFGVAALDNKSSFDRHPTLSTGNDGNDFAVACDVAFGAAAVMAVTSALLIFTPSDDTNASATSGTGAKPTAAKEPDVKHVSSSSSFTAAPMLSPHTAGASAVLHF